LNEPEQGIESTTMEENPLQRPARRLAPVQVGGFAVYQIVSAFYRQNCYVIAEKETAAAVVIDPGYGACSVVNTLLAETGCALLYIVLTHGHIDHIANLNELRAHSPCKVVATSATSEMLPFPKKNLSAFYPVAPYAAERADILTQEESERLPWGMEEIILHASPGHTTGCLTVEMQRMLFTGDTLIKDEKTVVKLPGGNGASLAKSLKFIFEAFPPECILFPGHGESLLLGNTQPEIHCPSYARRSNGV
jgi:glyoxylase-like metal-dependent hydrolase (beta-lactamase superfamily II)